jgi:hypothetical protein
MRVSNPKVMTRVLGIVYRAISTQLAHKAGFAKPLVQTGAVTLIQRFGSALNLNIHFHMLLLDGIYIDPRHGVNPRFRRAKAPTRVELTKLTHTIARRVGRYLESKGLLERNTGTCYLTPEAIIASDEDPSGYKSFKRYKARNPGVLNGHFISGLLPDRYAI